MLYQVTHKDFEGKYTNKSFVTRQEVFDYITSLDQCAELEITGFEQRGVVLQFDELETWMARPVRFGVYGHRQSVGGGVAIQERFEVVEHHADNYDYADRIGASYKTFDTETEAETYRASEQAKNDAFVDGAIDREFGEPNNFS